MLILIENGQLFTPARAGNGSVLIVGERILKVGSVDRRAIDALDIEYQVIDASGRLVMPGIIDPHEHLRGGSGEKGFSSETPTIFIDEIVAAGITTVVGTLGVDTTMTVMSGLLARVKALNELGMTAFAYSGGYNVPPSTVTQCVRNDLLFIAEIIGAGEISISDERSLNPNPGELASLVSTVHVGGLLSGKAGITHFHVGPGPRRISILRTLIDEFDVKPEWLYPTHLERNEKLMREGMELAAQGATIDIDVVEKDLAKWLTFYYDHRGDPGRLTISSDSFSTGPHNLLGQIRECVLNHGFELEQILPHVTSNTARVLKLDTKGALTPGMDADVLILEADTHEITDVIARGNLMVRDGSLQISEKFLQDSDRAIVLRGHNSPAESPLLAI